MKSAETLMQKHLVTAKPSERATQSAQPSGNQWPEADWRISGKKLEKPPLRKITAHEGIDHETDRVSISCATFDYVRTRFYD